MGIFNWLHERRQSPSISLADDPKFEEYKIVAEPVAKVSVLPAQWIDKWPLWEMMKPHVPDDREEWARFHHEVFVFWMARDCFTTAIRNRPDAAALTHLYDSMNNDVRRKRLTPESIEEATQLYKGYTMVWSMWENGWESERLGRRRKDPTIIFTQYNVNMLPDAAIIDFNFIIKASTVILEMHEGFRAEIKRILRDLPTSAA